MIKQKRFTVFRITVAVSLAIIFFFIGSAFYQVGEYYKTLDDYSGAISRGDQLAARNAASRLDYFYEFNQRLKKLHLDGMADKYLFKEVQEQRSAYDYLVNNQLKVTKDLENNDSPYARFIRANSTWRLAQGIFRDAMNMDPQTMLKEQQKAKEMAASTKNDYEWIIRNSQNSDLEQASKWNYDLTTDPEAMMRGLMPRPVKIKTMLGEGGNKGNNPGELNGEAPGKGTLNLDRRGDKKPGNTKPGSKKEG